MDNFDLAGVEHWDSIYNDQVIQEDFLNWEPSTYSEKLLEQMFDQVFLKYKPKSILEIGCGNSMWLGYLGKKYTVEISGLDYSEPGCTLAKERLSLLGLKGQIYCKNFFDDNSRIVGKYDLVFSLGVVEHFDNTELTISCLSEHLKPAGILLTEVPNFNYSLYYFVSLLLQPKQLRKHKIFGLRRLYSIYKKLNFCEIEGEYLGFVSLDVIAWGLEPRNKYVNKYFTPWLKMLSKRIDRFNISCNYYSSKVNFLSSYFYILGKKKCAE